MDEALNGKLKFIGLQYLNQNWDLILKDAKKKQPSTMDWIFQTSFSKI